MKRTNFLWHKISRFEFWPFWVFYSPFLFVGMYFALKARRFLYFSAVNPLMHLGGLFHYSKGKALSQLSPKFLPKTSLFTDRSEGGSFYLDGFQFPFIYKPDFGERGKDVILVKNEKQWEEIYQKINSSFLIQEFIDYPIELGVLYYRFPHKESGILSIVSKGFLTIVGDGKLTFKELIDSNLRASGRLEYLYKKFAYRLGEILTRGEEVLLEEIGNHCRGTEFINSNELITEKLVQVFNEIASPLKGFHYGRFDLKVPSLEDLYAGRNIKILEVNGVNSEAAHIYDKDISLLTAYKDVWKQQNMVYKLAKANIERGVETPTLFYFIRSLVTFWKN